MGFLSKKLHFSLWTFVPASLLLPYRHSPFKFLRPQGDRLRCVVLHCPSSAMAVRVKTSFPPALSICKNVLRNPSNNFNTIHPFIFYESIHSCIHAYFPHPFAPNQMLRIIRLIRRTQRERAVWPKISHTHTI
jgi:hypothetical protein